MARTGHLAADVTFPHMMHTKCLAAFRADKSTFFAHLSSAERAGVGMRAPDMMIAARARHQAIKTDRMMADVTFNDMDIADNFTTFATGCRTCLAEMLMAFAAAEQMRWAIGLPTEMANLGTTVADDLATFGTLSDATCFANLLAADIACFKACFAGGMFAAFAYSSSMHLCFARRAFRIYHLSGKQIVMLIYGD
jgi:hypothetical protein